MLSVPLLCVASGTTCTRPCVGTNGATARQLRTTGMRVAWEPADQGFLGAGAGRGVAGVAPARPARLPRAQGDRGLCGLGVRCGCPGLRRPRSEGVQGEISGCGGIARSLSRPGPWLAPQQHGGCIGGARASRDRRYQWRICCCHVPVLHHKAACACLVHAHGKLKKKLVLCSRRHGALAQPAVWSSAEPVMGVPNPGRESVARLEHRMV